MLETSEWFASHKGVYMLIINQHSLALLAKSTSGMGELHDFVRKQDRPFV